MTKTHLFHEPFWRVQVPSDQQLGQLLNNFKEGNTHISMVVEVNTENPDIDPFYELKVCGKLQLLAPQAWWLGG